MSKKRFLPRLTPGPSVTTLAFERSCHSGLLHTMIRSHHRGAGKRTIGPAMIPESPSPCASELPSLPKEALSGRVATCCRLAKHWRPRRSRFPGPQLCQHEHGDSRCATERCSCAPASRHWSILRFHASRNGRRDGCRSWPLTVRLGFLAGYSERTRPCYIQRLLLTLCGRGAYVCTRTNPPPERC
jgi:hypothetical protein